MPERVCSVDGCTKSAHWKDHGHLGMCSAHYQRVRIHGSASVNKRGQSTAPTFKECRVEGCAKNAARSANGKKGMCQMHYARMKKHGDPHRVDTTPRPAMDWLVQNSKHSGDECLTWPFAKGKDGYGRVHRPSGNLTTASRVMCELAHGSAPSSKHEAAHSCGKGDLGCVNPNHLYWATPKRNHADKVKHGTTNRGDLQWQCRLTEADVKAIRVRAELESNASLASEYGVDPSHISKIVSRSVWNWLD